MISLRKATTDLERVESLRDAFAESFRTAILDSAEYAIELDSEETRNFQERLEKLAAALKLARESESVQQVKGNFRGALDSYHDQAQSRIEHLRQEVEAAAAAVAKLCRHHRFERIGSSGAYERRARSVAPDHRVGRSC